MIGKSLIAATAIAASLMAVMPASEARADVDVSIGIGIGGYYPGYPAYGGYYGYRGGDAFWPRDPRRVSCNRGAAIVDNAGFHRVNPINCGAPFYVYTAWKRGEKFVVRVNQQGAITSIRRVL